MRIQNNVSALNAHRYYGINQTNTQKSIAKLSSGYRINSAADDAAGLAISEKMRAQIRGLTMASKNTQDAISLIQTAEGGMQEIDNMLQRIRELTVYASNDTNDLETFDRQKIQDEIDSLIGEIDSMAERVEFNNKKIINGSFSDPSKVVADLTTQLTAKNADLTTKAADLSTASTKFTTATNDYVNAGTAYDAKFATYKNALSTYNGALDDYNDAKEDLAVAEATFEAAKATWAASDKSSAAASTYQQAVTDHQSAVTTFQTEEATYNAELSTYNAELKTYNDAVDTYEKAKVTYAGDQQTFADAADAYGKASTAVANLQARISNVSSGPKGSELYFQIGANSEQKLVMNIGSVKTNILGIGDGNGKAQIDVREVSGSEITGILDQMDEALLYVTTERSKLGAAQNRLEYTMNSLDISAENLTAAESRIRDVDMAKEMSNFTKQNILFQASIAMLAQANAFPQGVLQLLG
jgi:flagellin